MKYELIILEKLGEKQFRKIGKKKFNPEKDKVISFKKKTCPLTPEMYSYIDKKKTYIFGIVQGSKISIAKFNEFGIGIDSEFLDKLLTTSRVGIIGQLVGILHLDTTDKKTDWSNAIKPIMYLVIGGIVGYLAGGGSLS